MATASLNAAQRNHAEKRIKEIQGKTLARLTTENKIPAVTLTNDQKKSLILRGVVKIRKDLNFDRSYYYPGNLFDFSKHEKPESLKPGTQKKIDIVNSAAEKAIDHIIMGDAQEALDGIKAFEASMAKM